LDFDKITTYIHIPSTVYRYAYLILNFRTILVKSILLCHGIICRRRLLIVLTRKDLRPVVPRDPGDGLPSSGLAKKPDLLAFVEGTHDSGGDVPTSGLSGQ
jgi:hypothetical protein